MKCNLGLTILIVTCLLFLLTAGTVRAQEYRVVVHQDNIVDGVLVGRDTVMWATPIALELEMSANKTGVFVEVPTLMILGLGPQSLQITNPFIPQLQDQFATTMDNSQDSLGNYPLWWQIGPEVVE